MRLHERCLQRFRGRRFFSIIFITECLCRKIITTAVLERVQCDSNYTLENNTENGYSFVAGKDRLGFEKDGVLVWKFKHYHSNGYAHFSDVNIHPFRCVYLLLIFSSERRYYSNIQLIKRLDENGELFTSQFTRKRHEEFVLKLVLARCATVLVVTGIFI